MSQWTTIADWVGPTQNRNPGALGAVVGVVLHIQEGSEAGSIAWCKNPASQASAHFFAPKSGRLQQLVDTADRAWAEAAGNDHWLSIENEGYTGQSLTADQVEACAQILAMAHRMYSVPLVVTDSPAVGGLGWHGMGGDAWGGHFDCPGEPVKAQRGAIIARAHAILGTPAPTPTPAPHAPAWPNRTFVYDPNQRQMHGADIGEWQQRMAARGWHITIDGFYGQQSHDVCTAFQQDSTAHGWPLTVDGEVGPRTWTATWSRPVTR